MNYIKKLILFALLAISTTSCFKEHQCVCDLSLDPQGSMDTTIVYTVKKSRNPNKGRLFGLKTYCEYELKKDLAANYFNINCDYKK